MKKYMFRLFIAFLILGTVTTTLVVSPNMLPADAQVTPLDDEPEDAPGLGSIVGSPDAGPDPEDAGDRGGYAQLGLALVLLGAVCFIGWRITSESKRNRRRSADNMSPDHPL